MDLQFAIDAGDEAFAPALKLLIREALHVAHNSQNMSTHAYQATHQTVLATYQALLRMETDHPVARRLQARYRAEYGAHFWCFLERERAMFDVRRKANHIVSVGSVDKSRAYFAFKRIFNFSVALLMLVLALPAMLGIAILIKLDSPGPVFYVSDRVGAKRHTRRGITAWEMKNFRFIKFRTMVHNADQTLHKEYIKKWMAGQQDESGDPNARFKLGHDPRVTRVGRFLRSTSLDEVPQLFNILKGEMSLVGPRPLPIYEIEQYQPHQLERLAATPGITGLWQIKGRGQVTFQEQVQMDIDYVRTQSLWLDLQILLLTVPAVLKQRGAR